MHSTRMSLSEWFATFRAIISDSSISPLRSPPLADSAPVVQMPAEQHAGMG